MAGIIVALILEANTDVVFMECPKLLDEPVIKFACPFAGKEFYDGCAPPKEFGTVSPAAVFGIGKRDAGRVAAVPCVLGKPNFFSRSFEGEGRKGRAAWHGNVPFPGIRTTQPVPCGDSNPESEPRESPKSMDHHRGRPGRDNVSSALGILAALLPRQFIRRGFAFSTMKRVYASEQTFEMFRLCFRWLA